MRKYKVTCLSCNKFDVITVDDRTHQVIDYEGKMNTNFQSFRFRPDLQWGFYCECGNDNRLANNEAENFDKLVKGDPISLQKVAESLLIDDRKQFAMEDV